MYIIMHGDKNGFLHSTKKSIGIKPISLLKQLRKRFPLEKKFYICCCYSNFCFPNGTEEYNGVSLTPMIWSNYPVSHYMIWGQKITKRIMENWNLPLPTEEKENEKTEIIMIKEWCQKHHLNFNNLTTIDKREENGCTWNEFLKGNEIELCNKLSINYELVEDNYYDAIDFVRKIFEILFPNYKLHFYRIGNMIFPHYLEKR